MLVPANTDLALEVSAKDYETWYYHGTLEKSRGTPLCLTPGQEMKLDIRLSKPQNEARGTPNLVGCGTPVETMIKP